VGGGRSITGGWKPRNGGTVQDRVSFHGAR
jgi:hypothetical protein